MSEFASGLGSPSTPHAPTAYQVPTFEVGGRGRRLGAALVDGFIQAIPILVIMAVVVLSLVDRPWFVEQPDGTLDLRFGAREQIAHASQVAGLIAAGFVALYGIVFIGLWGKTPGKKAVGLRVVSTDDGLNPTPIQAVTREFMRALPGVAGAVLAMMAAESLSWVGGIGSFVFTGWLLWDPLAQTIYDKAAGTVVVRDRPVEDVPPAARSW
jgi:uncharacterized RDD family membrane protein YckC